jgi:DNA-binding CsgD family transcriptional regulator/tetratricopeptide (TPR) repeat protein
MAAADELIVGRSAELALCAEMLGRRLPWTCSIVGPAGIGKTTVWRALVSTAADRGWRVLVARPTQVSRAVPFGTLAELLDSVPDTAVDALPGVQATALRRVSGTAEGTVDDRHLLVVALRRLLGHLGNGAQVLVAVDDEQWIDAASATVLMSVLAGLNPPAVAVATSRRLDDASPLLRPADGMPWPRQIDLGPLGLGATRRLLHDRFGSGWSQMLVRRIWERSAGNPFTALELARAVTSHRAEPLPDSLPLGSLEETLRNHVATLRPGARTAAMVTAVLGRPTVAAIKRVAQAADVAVDVDGALDAGVLVSAGRAGDVEFSHPLLAEAVLSSLSPSMRRRLHVAAAELAGSPAERAIHLAELAEEPDESLAQSLETALLAFGPTAAPETTVPLAERALAVTPPGEPSRFRRRLLLVDMLLAAGDDTRARTEVDHLLADAAPGRQRADALWRAYEASGHVDLTNALADLERALSELGWTGSETPGIPPEDMPLAAEIMHAYIALLGINSSQLDRAQQVARDWWAYAAAHLTNEELLTATVSRAQIEMLTDPVAARTLLEPWRDTDPASTYVYGWPRLWLGLQDMWHGHLDRADDLLTSCIAAAGRSGDEMAEDVVVFHLAELRWRQGRWDEADELVQSSLDRLLEAPGVAAATGYVKALLAACRGDAPAAVAEARRWGDIAKSLGDTLWVLQNAWAEGHALLVSEDPRAADVLGSLEQYFQHNVEVGVFPFRPDAVEALVRAGRVDDAERMLSAVTVAAEAIPGHLWARATERRCRGLLASARGQHEQAVELLAESVTQCRTMGAPYELARSLLALGGALRRTRHRTASAHALEEARDTFTYLGAKTWATRTEAELSRVAAPADRQSLTPTESRIATLAARGNTNAEIAHELLVSVKTVEANLTRVYAKLGVRSRTRIAGQLAARRDRPSR